MQDTEIKLMDTALKTEIQPFLFDYSDWSAYWATDSHIAPCLADYVNAISESYKNAGGDGRVILVAHSMGGLAIQYAASSQYVINPISSYDIPYVITLDTPYLGSPFGGGAIASAIEKSPLMGGVLHGGGVTSNGSLCLTTHTPLLDWSAAVYNICDGIPPPLPIGVDLTQIAGDITLDRLIFGITFYKLPFNSDGIVTVPSQHGYLDSAYNDGTIPQSVTAKIHNKTNACDFSSDVFLETLVKYTLDRLVPYSLSKIISESYSVSLHDIQTGDVPDIYSAALSQITAGCSHAGIITDNNAMNQVVDTIGGALTELTVGNTAGNIINQGLVAKQGDWIYFNNTSDNHYLYKMRVDGTGGKIRLNNMESNYINVVGDWVYYASGANGHLYKVRTDGVGDIVQLNNESANYVNVVGSWIYYERGSTGYLYKMRTDGVGGEIQLNSKISYYINVVGNWVYYAGDSNGYLYKIRTDGTDETQLSSNTSGYINAINNLVYYANGNDSSYLYKISENGTNNNHQIDWVCYDDNYFNKSLCSTQINILKTKINNLSSNWVNVVDGWIYFSDNGRQYLQKMRIDGTELTTLNNDSSYYINVVDGWIYYGNGDDNGNLYKIRIDGSDRQKL